MQRELKEPRSTRARLVRRLRLFRNLRGWQRVMNAIVPCDPALKFVARNSDVTYVGNLESFIDRQIYLYGGYEELMIARFLDAIPTSRRGLILDVGANVGTHTLRFAQAFQRVLAFEPNPRVFEQLSANVAANAAANVELHPVGLADRDATLDFFVTDSPNQGMGTFATTEQYDTALVNAGQARVVRGDAYLGNRGVVRVDAIKIDIQGFEPEALLGLQEVLVRDRPFVWFEVGSATRDRMSCIDVVRELLPYEPTLLRFMHKPRYVWNDVELVPVGSGQPFVTGDYLAVPP
jgi:FkbM family methyltransferase